MLLRLNKDGVETKVKMPLRIKWFFVNKNEEINEKRKNKISSHQKLHFEQQVARKWTFICLLKIIFLYFFYVLSIASSIEFKIKQKQVKIAVERYAMRLYGGSSSRFQFRNQKIRFIHKF